MQGWIHVGIEVDRWFIRVILFIPVLTVPFSSSMVCDHFRWVFLYTLDKDVHIWEIFIVLVIFLAVTMGLRVRPASSSTICFGYDNLLRNRGFIENALIEYVLRIHSFQYITSVRSTYLAFLILYSFTSLILSIDLCHRGRLR